jgi:methionine-gamma-lyase
MKNREINGKKLRPESLMMSYGYDPMLSEGAIKSPIFQTSTFVFKNAEEGKRFFEIAYGLKEKEPGEEMGLIYSRLNNPDLEILEDRLTLWDDAEEAAVFDSGMAAISTALLTFLRPGDTIVHSEPVYGGTDYFIINILPSFGINRIGFKAKDSKEDIEKYIKESGYSNIKMFYIETPANPTNDLIDIEMCADLAKKYSTSDKKCLLAVDNTFLGPLFSQPISLGADLVLYSATKFIGGHSDLIAGVCLGNAEHMKQVKGMRTFLGTMAGPWVSWLMMRSLETLQIRMTRMCQNAKIIADYLQKHPKVERVYFLGNLEKGSVQEQIFKRQCHDTGSMISFDIKGGEKEAFLFLNNLQLIKLAVSLGGTESLAEHPATMTHSDISPELQKTMNITEKMVRLSIGVEHPDDVIADIEQALSKA